MPGAAVQLPGCHQVAAEDARERVPVREVEVALAGDRYVELHRIDAAAEKPLALTAPQDGAQRVDQRRVQLAHALRMAHVSPLVQVLAVQQRHELRMLEVVSPGEIDQAPERFAGVAVLEVEILLRAAD